MTNKQAEQGAEPSAPLDHDPVVRLARGAIKRLLTQDPTNSPDDRRNRAAAWLLRATRPPWALSDAQLLDGIESFALSPAELLDHCITHAARQLGESWLADDMPFSDVTLGAARLMQLAHHLIRLSPPQVPGAQSGLHLLVTTPAQEQHILGALILSDQLRRQGHRVHLLTGATPSELGCALTTTPSEAVIVSVGSWAMIDASRALITRAAQQTPAPRTILGGALLDTSLGIDCTGMADRVTNDINAALAGLAPRSEQTERKGTK